MKWDVSYVRTKLFTGDTTGEKTWWSKDDELNYRLRFVEANSAEEAMQLVKWDIIELMGCNCLTAEEDQNGISVYEPSDYELCETYTEFCAVRVED